MQPGSHLSHTVERRFEALLVQQAHDGEVLLALCTWLIVQTAAVDTRQITLAADTDLLIVLQRYLDLDDSLYK